MRTLARAALVCASSAVLGVGLAATGGAAFAAKPPGTGQPNVECPEPGVNERPGNSESAPGSAFNPGGIAGMHYAGEQPQNTDKGFGHSVSQYDVACFRPL